MIGRTRFGQTIEHFMWRVSSANVSIFAIVGMLLASPVYAHVAPINVFLNAATNRLFTLENFAPGYLTLTPGVEIFTTTPGIGINFPGNGVPFNTVIIVDAMPGLYYWNGGTTVGQSSETLTWDPPLTDILGNPSNGSGHFAFSATSDVTLGMIWATYIDTFFWEADGRHRLLSLNAPPGIYGTVIRLRSDRHLASLPFVVPFVYDPLDQWTLVQEDAGVAVMRALTPTHMPGDFDLDRDFDCQDVDQLVARIVSGPFDPVFDRYRDGVLDGRDLERWLVEAAAHNLYWGQGYRPGDANLDGIVDGRDWQVWNTHKFTADARWCRGDFNADGVVDGRDFNLWNAHREISSGPTMVPEPMVSPTFWLVTYLIVRFWTKPMPSAAITGIASTPSP